MSLTSCKQEVLNKLCNIPEIREEFKREINQEIKEASHRSNFKHNNNQQIHESNLGKNPSELLANDREHNDDQVESDLNRYDAVIDFQDTTQHTTQDIAPRLSQSISSFNLEDKFNNFSMGVVVGI